MCRRAAGNIAAGAAAFAFGFVLAVVLHRPLGKNATDLQRHLVQSEFVKTGRTDLQEKRNVENDDRKLPSLQPDYRY